MAACAPARGTILEIGSYKGKSTVGLASIAQRYGLGPVVSVDPHSAPAVTDFGHGSQQSSWDDFRASLRTAAVENNVEDIDLFLPHLVPGAVVAMHDVLHSFEGPVRVFAEELLASDEFGPAGLCGSIGWAQYRPQDGRQWRTARRALGRRVGRLIPFVRDGRAPTGLRKLRYKFWRGLVPHAAPDGAAWVRAVS